MLIEEASLAATKEEKSAHSLLRGGENTAKRIRGSSGKLFPSSSSPIFALQAKIHSFFVKELLDQSYKIYQGIKSINPNLMIVVY